MKLIAAVLMFAAVSAFAQDKPKESYICLPEGVVRAAVELITQQQKIIAELQRQLAERK